MSIHALAVQMLQCIAAAFACCACQQVYLQLRQQIILAQPADKQPHLAACLDKLMTDVSTNLEPKNRDKFTQNLTIVRHEYRSKS